MHLAGADWHKRAPIQTGLAWYIDHGIAKACHCIINFVDFSPIKQQCVSCLSIAG